MNRLPHAILLLLTLAGFAVGGSHPYFSISHIRQGKYLHFPINTRRNPPVETKINQFLQLSELRGLVNRTRTDVFHQATIDDGSIYGKKVSLSYHVYTNNSRTLSVSFGNSMDGATTHWWTSYYNFNSENGDDELYVYQYFFR